MRPAPIALACAAVLGTAGCAEAAPAWRALPAAAGARTEVAGAALGGRVAVVGGVAADGAVSARVDLYVPARSRWTRLPDLPAAVHRAMAAVRADRLYAVGGYDAAGVPQDRAWVLIDRRWRPLPRLPEPRAAAGPAIVRNRLYVVGGVGPAGLARSTLAGTGWRACRAPGSTWASPPWGPRLRRRRPDRRPRDQHRRRRRIRPGRPALGPPAGPAGAAGRQRRRDRRGPRRRRRRGGPAAHHRPRRRRRPGGAQVAFASARPPAPSRGRGGRDRPARLPGPRGPRPGLSASATLLALRIPPR